MSNNGQNGSGNGVTDFNDVATQYGDDALRNQVIPTIEAKPVQGSKSINSDWDTLFLRTEKGGIKACVHNVDLIFNNHESWVGVVGYCAFSYRIVKLKAPPWGGGLGEWTSTDTIQAKLWLGREYGLSPNTSDVDDAIVVLAKNNMFHPIQDYLNGLKWDGKERLSNWMEDILEAEGGHDYLSVVGKRFLIGAVARIMKPPAKMDNVLILEGLQGIGKSTLVRMLFKGWSSESALDLSHKDAYQQIQGVWGVELAELDSFNKAEGTTAKNFFSVLEDRFRPPYGRVPETFPRQCVFIGTTNQDEYLKDYSGNRRYWPVRCHSIHIETLESIRDQLWAEAMHLYQQGERWWIDGDEVELFTTYQEDRLLSDPWEESIYRWLNDPGRLQTEYFASIDILKGALQMDDGHIQRAHQNRIAPILKHLGWIGTRKRIKEGTKTRQIRVYLRPRMTDKEAASEF